jgi:Txe/YoeB family toxin of Txe-Axe toxin-antitoxin module
MDWNPVLKLFKEIKNAIKSTGFDIEYKQYSLYNSESGTFKNITCFEFWVELSGKKEWLEFISPLQFNQKNNLLLIRYGKDDLDGLVGMWEDKNSIYRECRSLVIDMDKEKIVLCPFRKFFNLNEVPENDERIIGDKINKSIIFEISNKLDGSMQSARYYDGEIIMAGSMAIDKENSWRLQDGYDLLTDKHIEMFKDLADFTFIFEYVGKQNPHVVNYKFDKDLILIGMRNVKNGKEMDYDIVQIIGKRYGVKTVKIENLTFDELLYKTKNLKANEKEGWVLNIDGHKVKIKCDDYVSLHRILDRLASINVIIEAIVEDKYDDLISKVPDRYAKRINKIATLIYEYQNKVIDKVNKYFNKAPKNSRKDFMIWTDKNVEKEFNGYVKLKYLNKEWHPLKKGGGAYKKFKDMYNEPIEYYLGDDYE